MHAPTVLRGAAALAERTTDEADRRPGRGVGLSAAAEGLGGSVARKPLEQLSLVRVRRKVLMIRAELRGCLRGGWTASNRRAHRRAAAIRPVASTRAGCRPRDGGCGGWRAGPGPPQSSWSSRRHLQRSRYAAGISPEEIR